MSFPRKSMNGLRATRTVEVRTRAPTVPIKHTIKVAPKTSQPVIRNASITKSKQKISTKRSPKNNKAVQKVLEVLDDFMDEDGSEFDDGKTFYEGPHPDGSGTYSVQEIIGHQIIKVPKGTSLVFWVKWDDYPDPQDYTYEPAENLNKGKRARRALKEYCIRHLSKGASHKCSDRSMCSVVV